MGVKIDSYCGLVCETCEFRETMNCGGCIATGGKPFHGHCDVAACAVEKKRAFCGDCAEFPCETLKAYSFDPVHGDDGARIENVRRQKAAKVAEARNGIDPVGVCGHHCDHCFLGQWCGGCRSAFVSSMPFRRMASSALPNACFPHSRINVDAALAV